MFSVSVSSLHEIMPVRLMGVIIVTVALMKEPLLKVTCATTSEESGSRFKIIVPLLIEKVKSDVVVVEICQKRSPNLLVHQNTTASEHGASLPLT